VVVALLAALALAAGGCGRKQPADGDPFLARPAPGPDGRVAFAAQSRIWIASQGADRAWRAEPLPLEVPADRPHWLRPATQDSQRAELAMIAWYEPWSEKSELAIWNGKDLQRLTITAEDEVLDDTAPGGRLLFERAGMLFEAAVEPSADGIRMGQEIQLVPGRDARYTPDGRHVLFVRGHESDPLGIWRQGYQGGDDSEVYHLDLLTREVTQLTDNPDNDEQPIPLDDLGRRFIVCRERGGLGYRPWIVEVITPKKHRVRRLAMPEGPWPVLFPAVRWLEPPKSRLAALVARDTTLAIEVWAEANGQLIMTGGEVQPAKLAFPAAEQVPMRLAGTALPPKLAENQLGAADARAFSLALGQAITSSELADDRWQKIPAADRRRLGRAAGAAVSEPERNEIVLRLLGRCGLPGFDYFSPWGRRPPSEKGLVTWPQFWAGDSTGPRVSDLRGRDLLMTSDWEREVGHPCAEGRPVVVLIDERTANLAEVTAAGYRSGGCALLVGRTTSGLAMMVERHGIPMRGSIEKAPRVIVAVPNGPIRISPTLVLGPEGVVPDLFVPPGASEEVWQATVNKAREQLRK
jgi:hypothetical protein